MKKISIIFLILFLVLFTAFIKNSTKRIDDEIFTLKESIRDLKKDFGKTRLENEYLSSAEKLIEFQEKYFEDQLVKKDIQKIIIIDKSLINFDIKKTKQTNE